MAIVNSLAAFADLPQAGVAPRGRTTELIISEGNTMKVILRDGAKVVGQSERSFAWDAKDQTLTMENSVNTVRKELSAGVGWKAVRLIKGADGAIYIQSKSSGVGALFYIIPFGGREERWGRWEPAH
jgi:hypothetical protein